MIASIAWLQSAINFFLNKILSYLSFLKLSETYHHFIEYIIHLYIVILNYVHCKITQ